MHKLDVTEWRSLPCIKRQKSGPCDGSLVNVPNELGVHIARNQLTRYIGSRAEPYTYCYIRRDEETTIGIIALNYGYAVTHLCVECSSLYIPSYPPLASCHNSNRQRFSYNSGDLAPSKSLIVVLVVISKSYVAHAMAKSPLYSRRGLKPGVMFNLALAVAQGKQSQSAPAPVS